MAGFGGVKEEEAMPEGVGAKGIIVVEGRDKAEDVVGPAAPLKMDGAELS